MISILGFVNLESFSDELLELECSENNEMKQCAATNMLVFMVDNLFEYLYAQFPCASLSADLIFPLVWDCVKRLGLYGFKVMALTADGAPCNRNFFETNKRNEDEIVYKSVNVFSKEKRNDYFL